MQTFKVYFLYATLKVCTVPSRAHTTRQKVNFKTSKQSVLVLNVETFVFLVPTQGQDLDQQVSASVDHIEVKVGRLRRWEKVEPRGNDQLSRQPGAGLDVVPDRRQHQLVGGRQTPTLDVV